MLTAKDVPGERLLGHIVHDWPVMIAEGEETRYVGDALVVLAAETKEAARQALELIRVEYEELGRCCRRRRPWPKTRRACIPKATCSRKP